MSVLTSEQLRRYNPWLTVAIAAIILTATLGLTFLGPAPGRGAPAASAPSSFSIFGAYQSPDRCRECHPEEFHAWTGTTHAQASFDPIFQQYLQQAEKPGECFACHATGYDTRTGQFVLAGVSCEACHGPYRPGHPEATMVIADSETLCGACHTSTLQEWKTSRHGQVGVSCGDCHEVHTQAPRAVAITNELCARCHKERTQDDMHRQHLARELRCIDCHLSQPQKDVSGAVSGHAVTGHAFGVVEATCARCHAATPEID